MERDRPIRQQQSPADDERSYPLTPSPGSVKDTASLRDAGASSIHEGGVIDHAIAQTTTPTIATSPETSQQHSQQQQKDVQQRRQVVAIANERPLRDLLPYFAGESEGLEFLFDQCSADRPVKGVHYVTPRKTYRHKRSTSRVHRLEPLLPPLQIQQELIRNFFNYVFPVMPIVDAKAFLEAFEKNPNSVSPLLLWSMFFAAANFIDKDYLRANRLPPRKILKEQYYQHAKDIYDNQDEGDKIILIAAALSLSMWYVDLEDRDGSWYWIGTATSLCHTIGLHRSSNYASMPSCPFPARSRQLWRRLWWCCYQREAWLAAGFGRPMRIHIDDCDEAVPHPEEIFEEWREIAVQLQEKYLPPEILTLTEAWIVMLHLSIYLGDILTMHYRPRSRLPAPATLRQQDADIVSLRNKVPATSFATPPIVLIHMCHLEMNFNAVLITLYRPYLACSPHKLIDQESAGCRNECILKAKAAASDTTNVLNKLMSLDAISKSPSSFVAALMTSMQVLVFDIRNSSGLGKSYATHQLDLHMLVIGHLRKTYWTADLQHNLFIEVMKVLNGESSCQHQNDAGAAPVEKADRDDTAALEHNGPDLFNAEHNLAHASLDDFFGMFNPFMGLPSHDDLG
ncbi:hypothetical protein PMZ80_005418 [Knufia obscura]|uniref:Xylanolytic transcriptional activator regulatory domain-containing protein n=1 Tax=Knufia obscura TaxID=1635080 RepID=A0ABR0RQH5_9EURO|nr:hypothetical protein PMZ80_005418 [Knufia obscura]